MKTLQAREKEEVGLQERKKHAASKAKKLRKSLQDVRVPHPPPFRVTLSNGHNLQGTHLKNEAQRAVHDHSEKIDKERAKLQKLEESLDEEESALDSIRDSLKGAWLHQLTATALTDSLCVR